MRINYFLLLMASLCACQLTIPYSEDIKYLEIDTVHNTSEKKAKFEMLKQKFLEVWRDTSNCYIEKPLCLKCPLPFGAMKPIEVSIVNILHTSNYDSLLILVSWYVAEHKKAGVLLDEKTLGYPMVVIIDSTNNWNFVCNKPIYSFGSGGKKGNQIKEIEFHLKRLIIKAGYLKEDKTPDPTFWNRLFIDPDIWFKDDKSTLQKLMEKIPFPGNVEKK